MDWAELYSAAFAPEIVLTLSLIVLAEVERRSGGRGGPGARTGTILLGASVALVVIALTPELLTGDPAGDLQSSLALLVGLAVIGTIWHVRDWGEIVRWGLIALGVLTAIHAVIVPVWDLSGHVAFTAGSIGLVVLVERRFVALAVVPVVMMPARVLAGVHTVPQVIAGATLAAVILVGLARYRPEFRQAWPSGPGDPQAVERS